MNIDRLKSTLGCYAVILPAAVLLLTFVYLPVVWAFSKSLYAFEVGSPSRFVGLGHYVEYLTADPTWGPSMMNMLLLTLFAVCVRLTCPLIVAKLIHSLPGARARHLYRIVFLIPIVVPGVAVQLIWVSLIYSDPGLINETLRGLGLDHWTRGWLADPDTALVCIMMMGFPFVGGFEVLVYYAGLAAIPNSVNESAALEGCRGVRKLFESARIDGAGHLGLYLKIIVPLSKPVFAVVIIMSVIGTWNNFLWPFITNTDGTHHVIASGLFVLATSQHASNFSTMYAAYAISSIPLLILFIYATRPFVEGMTKGALKA
jgi:ABC-type sugar transport system permease subunit